MKDYLEGLIYSEVLSKIMCDQIFNQKKILEGLLEGITPTP